MKEIAAKMTVIELPCTIELISLVEMLAVPKTNIAVVTLTDSIQPNTSTTWLEDAMVPICIQTVFIDTRNSMRQFVENVRAVTVANHSTNYNMLPSYQYAIPNDYKHYCVCGDNKCFGTQWRKKMRTEQRRAMCQITSSAAVTMSTPPNICMYTFGDAARDAILAQYARRETTAHGFTIGGDVQRAVKYSHLMDQYKGEFGFYDLQTMLPLSPFKGDTEAQLRGESETDEQCHARVFALYRDFPLVNVTDAKCVEGPRFDFSVESQKASSILTSLKYDAVALKFMRTKSQHCLPMCFTALCPTIIRLVRLNYKISNIIEKVALKSERFDRRRSKLFEDGLAEEEEEQAKGQQSPPPPPPLSSGNMPVDSSDSSSYASSSSSYDDDDDSDMGFEEKSDDVESLAHEEPSDRPHPLAHLSDSELTDFLEKKFAQSRSRCTSLPTCCCLIDEFIDNHVSTAFGLRCVPLPSAAVFTHLGDSVFDPQSPAMCCVSLHDSYSSLRLSDCTYAYLSAVERATNTTTKSVLYRTAMNMYNEEMAQFEYSLHYILEERLLERLMHRQLGNFTVHKNNAGQLEMFSRPAGLRTEAHAFQLHVARVRDRAAKQKGAANSGDAVPFGNVHGEYIGTGYNDLVSSAARYFPTEKRCFGLSDHVIALNWHIDAVKFATIQDWLPPYARLLIFNAMASPQRTNDILQEAFALAQGRGQSLLGERDEREIVHELSLSTNMRLVVARLVVRFCNDFSTQERYCEIMMRAILIVGMCRLCNEIVGLRRVEALQFVTKGSAPTPSRDNDTQEAAQRREKQARRKERIRATKQAAEAARKAAAEAKRDRLREQEAAERLLAEETERKQIAEAAERAKKNERRRDIREKTAAKRQREKEAKAAAEEQTRALLEKQQAEELALREEQAKVDEHQRQQKRAQQIAEEISNAVASRRTLSPQAPVFKPLAAAKPHCQQSLAEWFIDSTGVDLFDDVWAQV